LKLLDGGLSDSIPIVKALQDGYDKIIVVLTRDKDYVCKPYKSMHLYRTKYVKYPRLIEAMENRYNKYNVTRDLIEALNNEGKIIAIYPSKPININHLEKNGDKLLKIYNLGYQDCLKLSDKIKEYIGGDNNE
jgi:predicted patatin/cPLA2 family phospholipase